jgi:hypothetical protein
MYGRADGMPSFQLTMAVRAESQFSIRYQEVLKTDAFHSEGSECVELYAIAMPSVTTISVISRLNSKKV